MMKKLVAYFQLALVVGLLAVTAFVAAPSEASSACRIFGSRLCDGEGEPPGSPRIWAPLWR